MLDLIPSMFPSAEDPGNHDRKFLEPACGSGNFLEEILRRKLNSVSVPRYGKGEHFEHRVLRCVASLYGIDICEENVSESRERLHSTVSAHVEAETGRPPSEDLESAVGAILGTNIICADTLADAASIEFVEYRPGLRGTFIRTWSYLEAPDSQLDLFGDACAPTRSDDAPVHYTELTGRPATARALSEARR